MKLEKVKSWWIQLHRHIRLDHTEDMIVMDIDAEVEPYRLKPDGTPRATLAYLSIGKAEPYRGYYVRMHERLAGDSLFTDDGRLKFWDPGWFAIVLDEARRARAKGFTGLYLVNADVEGELPQAHMGDLIRYIARNVPELDLVLVDALDLLHLNEVRPVLSGVAVTDLLYTEGRRNDYHQIKDSLDLLKLEWAGPLFGHERLEDRATARRAVRDLKFYGLVPCVG